MIQITVNGQPVQLPAPLTLEQLLETVPVPAHYLAIEVNEDVVARGDYATTTVQAGDEIEVVTLVGGG